MLNKCTTTASTLIVPDIEDSVPLDHKPAARDMIVSKLGEMRPKTKALIMPRTNEPGLPELFDRDIEALFVTHRAFSNFDGLCIPKMDTIADLKKVN